MPQWLGGLSKGGLTVPSLAFKALVAQFEQVFHDLHGQSLSYEKPIVRTTREAIMARVPEAQQWPDVVKTYARSRFFLRLRYLNFLRKEALAEARAKKRKAEAEAAATEAGPKPKKARKKTSLLTGSSAVRDKRKKKGMAR